MQKIMRIGTVKTGAINANLFVKAEVKDGRLSVTGVIGPRKDGNAWGSCGQIEMGFAHRNPAHDDKRYTHPTRPEEITFAPGWTVDRWLDLLDVWHTWHLNDMRAGCKHQRGQQWDARPIDPQQPTTAYGKFFPGQTCDSWNMLAWVTEKEHPQGLLDKACPECGHKYGHWVGEELPQSVIDFLGALPDTDMQPAWI